jgi:hypothetical protein
MAPLSREWIQHGKNWCNAFKDHLLCHSRSLTCLTAREWRSPSSPTGLNRETTSPLRRSFRASPRATEMMRQWRPLGRPAPKPGSRGRGPGGRPQFGEVAAWESYSAASNCRGGDHPANLLVERSPEVAQVAAVPPWHDAPARSVGVEPDGSINHNAGATRTVKDSGFG